MKKILTKWKEILFMLIVVVAAGIGVFLFMNQKENTIDYSATAEAEYMDLQKEVEFAGVIAPNENRDIYFLQGGKVAEVRVKNGDFVNAGDILVVLDDDEAQLALQEKELALEQAQIENKYNVAEQQLLLSELRDAVSANLSSALLAAEQEYQTAEENYKQAVDKHTIAKADLDNDNTPSIVQAKQALQTAENNYSFLSDSDDDWPEEQRAKYGLVISQAQINLKNARTKAKEEVDQLYEAVKMSEINLSKAKEKYDSAVYQNQKNEEKIKLALEKAGKSTAEDSAQLAIEQAERLLDKYTISAPISGYISGLDVKIGDNLESSRKLMTVQNFDTLKVTVKVDEYDLKYFEIGSPCKVYVRSLEESYDGEVSEMAVTATRENEMSYIETTICFDTDKHISSGLGAEVTIVTESVEDVIAVPEDAVQFDDDTLLPYVMLQKADGKSEKIDVTTGMSDGENVEITSGLSAGDVVEYRNAVFWY